MSPGFVPLMGCRLQVYVTWSYEKVFYIIESICNGKTL